MSVRHSVFSVHSNRFAQVRSLISILKLLLQDLEYTGFSSEAYNLEVELWKRN